MGFDVSVLKVLSHQRMRIAKPLAVKSCSKPLTNSCSELDSLQVREGKPPTRKHIRSNMPLHNKGRDRVTMMKFWQHTPMNNNTCAKSKVRRLLSDQNTNMNPTDTPKDCIY
eukprot:6399050-Amphidinium_carterae.1